MIYYKLTDENGLTHGGTAWAEGMTHAGTGKGNLCGPGWIHVYTHPLLAVYLNPIHADFKKPLLWRGIAEGKINDTAYGLKVGVERFTVFDREALPKVTTVQCVSFGVLCALEVHGKDNDFRRWANDYLSGLDRSMDAAKVVKKARWVFVFSPLTAKDVAWAAASEAFEVCTVAAPRRLPLIALAEKAMTFS